MLECFDVEKIKKVYGYNFDLKKIEKAEEVSAFDGTNIFMIQQDDIFNIDLKNSSIDFFVSIHQKFGSIILANGTGKAMKSSPLLGPFCGSEFWGYCLLKI